VQKTARLILPPRPTFTPIKTTQACKSKGSSPFQYCAECKFSLAAAQIGANIVASLTSGPTLTLSFPGFKPNSTLFIQANGGVNCASGTVAARLALLGPDGAEIAREHSKASSRAPSKSFDVHQMNVKGAADGFNSATIENLECTSGEQNNPNGIQSAVVSSDFKLVIESQ
jgi:hypothetical protein